MDLDQRFNGDITWHLTTSKLIIHKNIKDTLENISPITWIDSSPSLPFSLSPCSVYEKLEEKLDK